MAYSIITIVFALVLFLYAGLLALLKDYDLIPKSYMSKVKDKRQYTLHFALIIVMIAVVMAVSGIMALFGKVMLIPAIIVLVVGFLASIIIGVKIVSNDYE